MTRIDIERRSGGTNRVLWWVLGMIALVVIGMLLWFLYGRGRVPGLG